jgi:glucose-fructose oxidoreductase
MVSNPRRKFIRQIATAAAAVTVAPSLGNPLIPKAKDRLGVALVGLGYYSRELLAPALQQTKHCYLAGIVTGTPSKIPVWQQKYGIPDQNVYNYQNFDQVANNPDIDVVYVVLPNGLHKEFSVRAARAGKHVWCEKPMALNARECREMIKACADNKVKLSIGYRMQHDPNTHEIMRFAKEKTYGQVLMVNVAVGFRETRADHWHRDKALGGGAMYDMGVYPINAARYATGLEPVAVTAVAAKQRPEFFSEVDETMAFTLEFPGGVMANCATSLGMDMRHLLAVTCERGHYWLEPFQDYSGIKGGTGDGKVIAHHADVRLPHQQARQMDNDALAILQNQPVLVPGEEGLRDIVVLEAIYKSAKTGKRVLINR